MKLKHSYDYDRLERAWKKPNLIKLMGLQPTFLKLLETYTRAVQLIILPMPEQDNLDEEIDVSIRPRRVSTWAEHLRTRLSGRSTEAPCAYRPRLARRWFNHPSPAQRWVWTPPFSRVEDDDGEPAEANIMIDTGQGGYGQIREVFASYVFMTSIARLSKLKHVEPGATLRNHRGARENDSQFIANYALVFATATVTTSLPGSVNRLQIRSFPLNVITTTGFRHSAPTLHGFVSDTLPHS
jgi:hypothetical protein